MRLETVPKMCINQLFSTNFKVASSSCRSGPCKIKIIFSKDGKFLVQTPKRLLHYKTLQCNHSHLSPTRNISSRSCYSCTIQQCKTYTTLHHDGQTRQPQHSDKPFLVFRDSMDMNRVVLEAKEFLDSQGFPISSPASTSTLQSLFSNQAIVIQSSKDKLIGCPHPIVNLAKDFYRDRNWSDSENQWASIEMSNLRSDCQNSTATQGTYPSLSLSSLFSISVQLRAILVLLVSKSMDFPRPSSASPPHTLNQQQGQPNKTQSCDNGISPNESRRTIEAKQKSLSEITEIMYTAFTLHETIVDIPKLSQLHSNTGNPQDEENFINGEMQVAMLHHGNNLAALMGDLLLAKTSRSLASLRNAKVTEFMTETILDFAESQTLLLEVFPSPISKFEKQKSEPVSQLSNNTRSINTLNRLQMEGDRSNRKISNTNGEKYTSIIHGWTDINRETWFRKNQLGIGSLLGHACYCSSLFSGHDEGVRQLSYRLGEKLGLFFQACKEISFFLQPVNIEDTGNGITTEKNKLRFEGLEFKIEPFSTIPFQFDLCTLPIINALETNTISKDRIDELRKNFFHGYLQIFKEIQAAQRDEENFVRLRKILNNLEEDAIKLVQQLQSISPEQSTSNKAPKLLVDLIQSMRPL